MTDVPLENIAKEFQKLFEETHQEIQKNIARKWKKAPLRYKREILGFMTRLSQKGELRRRSGELTQSVDVQGFSQGSEYHIKAVSDKEYAAIQHWGGFTRPHIIRPKRAKVLKFEKDGKTVFAKSVRHPGSYIKPKYFFRFPMIKFTDTFLKEMIEIMRFPK